MLLQHRGDAAYQNAWAEALWECQIDGPVVYVTGHVPQLITNRRWLLADGELRMVISPGAKQQNRRHILDDFVDATFQHKANQLTEQHFIMLLVAQRFSMPTWSCISVGKPLFATRPVAHSR